MQFDVLEALYAGEQRAFRYIYDHYYDVLSHYAYQILKDSAEAEDIVNDLIFYLWENHSDIIIKKSLENYLITSVKNRCYNTICSLKNKNERTFTKIMTSEYIDFIDHVFFDNSEWENTLIENELREEIGNAVSCLPPKTKEAFIKSRFENKSYAEIAKEMKISPNTVKYHIKLALNILREKLNHLVFFCFCFFLK